MIKVIKHGKKEFTATCNTCGCKFTYELPDIIYGVVICPDCGNSVSHASQKFDSSKVLNESYAPIEYEEVVGKLGPSSFTRYNLDYLHKDTVTETKDDIRR